MSGKRTVTTKPGRYLPNQTRAAAGELDAIAAAQRDPAVTRIRVVPQQRGRQADQTADLLVDVRVRGGRIETQKREIKTLTGAGIGSRRLGTRQAKEADPDAIAGAIRGKIFPPVKPSQIQAGGDLVVQIRRGGPNVEANIAAAVEQMNPRLKGARFVRELHFLLPGGKVVRYVRSRNGTFVPAP